MKKFSLFFAILIIVGNIYAQKVIVCTASATIVSLDEYKGQSLPNAQDTMRVLDSLANLKQVEEKKPEIILGMSLHELVRTFESPIRVEYLQNNKKLFVYYEGDKEIRVYLKDDVVDMKIIKKRVDK